MKTLVSIDDFLKEELRLDSINSVSYGSGTTRNESYSTNWESDGGCDTERWTYSDDNSKVISAEVEDCEGNTRPIM